MVEFNDSVEFEDESIFESHQRGKAFGKTALAGGLFVATPVVAVLNHQALSVVSQNILNGNKDSYGFATGSVTGYNDVALVPHTSQIQYSTGVSYPGYTEANNFTDTTTTYQPTVMGHHELSGLQVVGLISTLALPILGTVALMSKRVGAKAASQGLGR